MLFIIALLLGFFISGPSFSNSEQYDKFIVFISLSMPKQDLQNLYLEAIKNNYVLVLRGLKNNSFKETADYLQDIKVSAEINPELFIKYKVERVPTFILLKSNNFASLSGNVSFAYAKKKLLNHED